ncbi:MAG: hypothetical protein WCI51_11030 [Lentisphaerota bacterium]
MFFHEEHEGNEGKCMFNHERHEKARKKSVSELCRVFTRVNSLTTVFTLCSP